MVGLKKIKIFLIFVLALFSASCSSDDGPETDASEVKDSTTSINLIPEILADSILQIDTLQPEKVKTERLRDEKKESMPTFYRTQEIGATDEKFNGEVVLIQLDVSKKNYDENPNLVVDQVKGNYENSKRYFPQDSQGKVADIKLNYRIELFEDGYAMKPYEVISMRYPNGK